jgi:hypothetical protein
MGESDQDFATSIGSSFALFKYKYQVATGVGFVQPRVAISPIADGISASFDIVLPSTQGTAPIATPTPIPATATPIATPTPLPTALVSPAFFVSPSGNDRNGGLSPASPFQSLTKAQAAMQSGSVKTAYLMGGTYAMQNALTLTGADSGESWLGYPGQTAVLNGQNLVQTGIAITWGTNNVTIRWLTIENYLGSGIDAQHSSGDLIDSNTILSIGAPDTGHGAIYGHFAFSNSQVTHNIIQNCGGPGISIAGGSAAEINSNLNISYNLVYNTNAAISDSGAIYILDRGHVSTGQIVSNNIIANFGGINALSKAIYLDDETSNVLVSQNIIYGQGQYGFQIHGGNNDVFSWNIFDISEAQKLALYQDDASSGFPNYGMANNAFQNNIVYSAAAAPASLWDYLASVPVAAPAVASNIYHATNGQNLNVGPITDRSPLLINPLFIDAAAANYGFQAGAPPLTSGFQNNALGAGPIPR